MLKWNFSLLNQNGGCLEGEGGGEPKVRSSASGVQSET